MHVELVIKKGMLRGISPLMGVLNVTYHIPDWYANKDFLVTITLNPGDFEGDGDVDYDDLIDLAGNYGRTINLFP